MTAMVARVRALWLLIQEPRVLSCIYLVVYLMAFAVGCYVLASPPPDVTSSIGAVVTTAWGCFLVIGGGLGAVAVLPGIWWLERGAVTACVTALTLYALVVWSQRPIDWPVHLGLLIIAALQFAVRWGRIRRYSYDPER